MKKNKRRIFKINIIGSGCCRRILLDSWTPIFDLENFGLFMDSVNPDFIIVSGVLNNHNIEEINKKQSKIILFGNCPINGGIFYDAPKNNDEKIEIQNITKKIYGCPPEVDDLLDYLFLEVEN